MIADRSCAIGGLAPPGPAGNGPPVFTGGGTPGNGFARESMHGHPLNCRKTESNIIKW